MKTKLTSIASCLLILMALVVAMLPALALPVSAADEYVFSSPNGEVAQSSATAPSAPDYSPEGYEFVGWTNAPITEATSETPTIYEVGQTVPAAGTYYALYFKGAKDTTPGNSAWTLVKNVADLAAGDKVIIAAMKSNYALGTYQKSNNIEAVSITKSGDILSNVTTSESQTSASSTNALILTLENGTVSGTFAFKTGSKYLYAASSSNNYLKSGSKDANASFEITVAADGTATATAQGSYTRNQLKKNSSSALFSCYGSGQDDICFYEFVETSGTTTYDGEFLTDFGDCEHADTYTSNNNGTHNATCGLCGDTRENLACNYDLGVETGTDRKTTTYTCEDCGHSYEKVQSAVTLMVNGEVGTTLYAYDGEKVTLTAGSDVGSFKFAGYSAEQLDNAETATLLNGEYTVNGDVTLHAVYKFETGSTTVQGWIKTDLADIDSTKPDVVVITMSKGGTTWALTSAKGTSASPTAVTVTVSGNQLTGDIAAALQWNIINNNGTLTIHVNGDSTKVLHLTSNSTTTIRVGNSDTNNTFVIDKFGCLQNVGTGRTIGAYNNNDWRAYTNTSTGLASNISGQTLAFYVQKDETVASYAYTTSLGECAHEDCTYTYNNDGTHTVACNDCDYTATVACSTEVSKVGNGQHKVTCTDCEHETLVDCTYTYTSHNDGTHTATCVVCGDAVTSSCEYNYTFTESNGKHNASCAFCHYSKTATPTYTNHTSNEDGTHTVDCNLCGDQHTIDCNYKAVTSGAAPETTTYTCEDCDYSYEKVQSAVTLNLLGKAYTTLYAYDGEALALPVLADMHEYTFIGWTTDEVDNAADADFFAESYTVNGAATLNALFALVVGGGSEGWVAKDLADIKANDVVVITMSKNGTVYAISNNGGASVAPAYAVVVADGDQLSGEIADNIKWNIAQDGNGFVVYVNADASKWLYTTDTNNGVRVGVNTDNHFVIDNGYIKNTATNRYLGIWIDGTTPKDWRCYTSHTTTNIAGQTLAFYVKDSGETYTYTTSPEVEHEHTFASARVNVGADLAMKFVVAPCCSYVDKVVFTMNGQTVEVTDYVVEGDKYVFTFANIAPQCMSDTITAELFAGDTLVDSLETSVKAYAQGILELYGDNETVVAMVSDMLAYGAAAQKYTGHNVGDLANEGVEGYAPTDVLPTDADKALDLTEGDYFFAAGVHFNNVNKIYAKFEAMSLENLTVTVNGEEAEIVALGNNEYVVYSEAIYATEFANEFVFVILVDGEAAQSLTYTVNTYANAKQNSATMGELAVALYRYGLSAVAYVNQ